MKITPQDFYETNELGELLTKIDSIDADYVNRISDEIFKQQPFFLSVLLGYNQDIPPEELEEIMKIYFLIWEYFRQNKNVQTKKVTKSYFEKMQNKNIQMLLQGESEQDPGSISKIYSNDLQTLKSKSLLTTVFFRYHQRPVLLKMDEQKKGIILIGIKSFIECFETI